MPTASDYRDAAERFRAISENLLREAGAVGGWATGFVSDGPIRVSIVESISRTHDRLVVAGEDMRRLALVCDTRADVCARYANDVWRYRQLTLTEQLLSGYPVRPASWVEL